MNKRQRQKVRRKHLRKEFGYVGKTPSDVRIHRYPNLVVDIDHKYKVVTITYNQQETPRGLPLSVLTHYIGCWSNTQKMHTATQRIIDSPEYEFVYNPFLPQSY